MKRTLVMVVAVVMVVLSIRPSRRLEPSALPAVALEAAPYVAEILPTGLRFEAQGATFETGEFRVAGGAGVTEEYIREPHRIEQLFHVAKPTDGALRITFPVTTNLSGPVVAIPRRAAGWHVFSDWDGGLLFCDAAGTPRISYHGAVAFDAVGKRVEFDPHYADGEITLEVPAEFVSVAVFPLTVDPWVEVGASATAGGISSTPLESKSVSLALDANGAPYVAWSETVAGDADRIYVKYWNGSFWDGLGGSDNSAGISDTQPGEWAWNPKMAIDPTGRPVVCWSDGNLLITNRIILKRWNGTGWVGLGNSATTGVNTGTGNGTNPTMALDSSGNPVVAWATLSSNLSQIYLRRWNGSAWVDIGVSSSGGGISGSTNGSLMPNLALDSNDNPYVAYSDGFFLSLAIYLKYWDGTAWSPLGNSGSGTGLSQSAGFCIGAQVAMSPSNRPNVSWTSGNSLRFRRWNGTLWEQLGTSAGNGFGSIQGMSSLAVDSAGNPMIAYGDTSNEIYLRRWTGTAWVELQGSATGGGISTTTTASTQPSMCLDANQAPSVAWMENPTGGQGANEIYFRRVAQNLPANLEQRRGDDSTPISLGQRTPDTTAWFHALLTSGDPLLQAKLEIEVQPVGVAFTGTATAESALVDSGTEVGVEVRSLAEDRFHWQARLVDSLGLASAWVPFGFNPESDADFQVDLTPPPPPPPPPSDPGSSGDSGGASAGCGHGATSSGASGIVALVMLLAMRARRGE